jgi:hypothetical protein
MADRDVGHARHHRDHHDPIAHPEDWPHIQEMSQQHVAPLAFLANADPEPLTVAINAAYAAASAHGVAGYEAFLAERKSAFPRSSGRPRRRLDRCPRSPPTAPREVRAFRAPARRMVRDHRGRSRLAGKDPLAAHRDRIRAGLQQNSAAPEGTVAGLRVPPRPESTSQSFVACSP